LRFLEKGFGTVDRRYKRRELNQTFMDCREALVGVAIESTALAVVAADTRKFRSGAADLGGDRVRYPSFESA
jgi:hypothetical protein